MLTTVWATGCRALCISCDGQREKRTRGPQHHSVNQVTQAAALRGERSGFVTQQVHGSMVLQCIFVHSDWITDNANRMLFLFWNLRVLQLVIFVLHTRIMRLTRSDTSSASAGDFCVTHTHHAPHTQWHKQCFSWWFLCYTHASCASHAVTQAVLQLVIFVLHASCASHAVTQAVLQLVIFVLHTRIMRLTRSDTSSASAGDFCVTHTHHAPHTQWHKQCFSWWFLCYTHASCASHAVTQAVLQLVISVLHIWTMCLTCTVTQANRTSFSKSWKWTNMRVYCMACLKREVAWFKAINISYGGCENKRCRQYFTNKNTHVHEEPCSSLPNLSMGAHTHTHTHA